MTLTIDTGAWLKAIRRAWWRLTGQRADFGQCVDCGKRLTGEELRYYGHTCERCEGIAAQQLEDA